MESKSEIEVKLLSSEMVKPSSPTPIDRQNFTLSFQDQNFPAPIQLPMILIYANNCTDLTTHSKDDVFTNLKTSLSETLTVFYPWAGRCDVDNSTILCHDQGVPFIEASVDCSLTDLLDSPRKLDVMGKFLPAVDLGALTRQSVSDFFPLSFQVNVFLCGGVVVGCYFFHKLMDVASLSVFFQYWAGVASKRYDHLVAPDFGATVAAFPPCVLPAKAGTGAGAGAGAEAAGAGAGAGAGAAGAGAGGAGAGVGAGVGGADALSEKDKEIAKLWLRFNSIKVVCRSFIFNKKSVKQLKAKAVSETVPNPTSFEVIAGFVWQKIISATSDKQRAPNALSFSANVRSKTIPPLPKAAVGNAVVSLHVNAEKLDEQLPYYVKEIHYVLSTVSEKVKTMQAENAAETLLAARNAGLQGYGNEKKATSYAHLSSWCRLGLYDVDFGFGKPTKVIPIGNVYPFLRNTFKFLEYKDDSDGDGIEVWLFMEEKEMEILKADTEFLDFASPS